MTDGERDKVIRGALALLAQDETLFDVAAHYGISKTTLIAALGAYAETEWKELQVARAQVVVQRASQKRMEIASQLEAFQVLEMAGGKTTETSMTYPRIREQLRIAEQEERSAQWHLERLHRRVYGNSLEVKVEQSLMQDPAWLKEDDVAWDRLYQAIGRKRPTEDEREAELRAAGITAGDDLSTFSTKWLRAKRRGNVIDVDASAGNNATDETPKE